MLLMEVLSHLVLEQKARGAHPVLSVPSCLPALGHSPCAGASPGLL